MAKFLVVSESFDIEDILKHYGDGIEIYRVAESNLKDPLPALVDQYLLFELDDDGVFTVDFSEVFNLMNYLVEKPLVVTQTMLRLHAALSNYYTKLSEACTSSKDELETFEATLRVQYATEEGGPKKTAANIDAMIKKNESWQLKKLRFNEVDNMKAQVFNARETVKRAYDLCMGFIKNGKNVHIENVPEPDKSSLTQVIADTNKINLT